MKVSDFSNYQLTSPTPCIWEEMVPNEEIPDFFKNDPRLKGTTKWMYKMMVWEKALSEKTRVIDQIASFILASLFAWASYFIPSIINTKENILNYNKNQSPRLQVAEALNGYGNVPSCHLKSIEEYLELSDSEKALSFKELKSPIYQGIDMTGRAFVAIEVMHKETKKIEYGTLYQSHHEVYSGEWKLDGVLGVKNTFDFWVAKLGQIVKNDSLRTNYKI